MVCINCSDNDRMERLRQSVLQVVCNCSEYDMQDPSMLIDDSEVSGTCFRVDPAIFLSHVPFYDSAKMYFVTNFHVIDEADERVVYLRTAGMGKNMATAMVEAMVPFFRCGCS